MLYLIPSKWHLLLHGIAVQVYVEQVQKIETLEDILHGTPEGILKMRAAFQGLIRKIHL